MDLNDTILNLKNTIRSKSKINIVKSNNKNVQNIKISKNSKYNFFFIKKLYFYFLKDAEVVNEKKY
jgi:hypothetical protein